MFCSRGRDGSNILNSAVDVFSGEREKNFSPKPPHTAIIINILKFLTFLLSSQAQKRDTWRWPFSFSFSFVLRFSKILPAWKSVINSMWPLSVRTTHDGVFLTKRSECDWLWTSSWILQSGFWSFFHSTLDKLVILVDAIAISEIWNYQSLTHWHRYRI